MQESIVAGTRVMTTSGLHATVTAVADDTIELEIAPGVYHHLGARRGPGGCGPGAGHRRPGL